MQELGRLEDLPAEYIDNLTAENLVPLWPSLRVLLPPHKPEPLTQPCHWRYENIRPLLMRAGDLTPIEKAERRVLVLRNPGLDPASPAATPVIYLGMQLIKPGELASNHRHSPSAIRLVVEGSGASTSVSGEKLIMERGDLILTPAGEWHEHSHVGSDPVVWLDALDLPMIRSIGAAYAVEGALQNASDDPDSSQTHYSAAGLLPYEALDGLNRPDYPMMRFPWTRTRAALEAGSPKSPMGKGVRLAFVNPETGRECLPVMGFSALMLRPGESVALPARSCAAVLHVIEGRGDAVVGDTPISDWTRSDTFIQPGHVAARVTNASADEPAFLVLIDEAPLHRKIGIYEEFGDAR